jgi:hypothetical protein
MPHFGDDLRSEDPAFLGQLRTLLHGWNGPSEHRPTLEGRFLPSERSVFCLRPEANLHDTDVVPEGEAHS